MNMAEKAWDFFVAWIFTSQGAATFAVISGSIMTFLTWVTERLSEFAPLSYGISFLGTFFIIIGLIGVFKSVFLSSYHKVKTFLEFDYDHTANALHIVDRGNVWGCRWIGPENNVALIVSCFDKPISVDYISVSLVASSGTRRMNPVTINFESRYSVIQLFFEGSGRYLIEYKYHGQ